MIGSRVAILKKQIFLIFILFILSCISIISNTPIHEAAHWIMSDIDPFIEPVEIHIFDDPDFFANQHVLSSLLGYVIIKEKYPGAFNDRPFWADSLQEIICISIQIIITVIILFRIMMIININYINLEFNNELKKRKKRVI